MIQVIGLGKNFAERKAISNLNFMVEKGEVVGFLGPNGAGKTTTLKIITGFMPSSTGQVLIDGVDVFEAPLHTKKCIGYLPEQPPVYTDMRVESYLHFVARLKKVARDKLAVNVDYALEKVHLKDVKRRLIGNLSKGYRQRVGLAAALVSKPEVLILDEPTVGLDPNQVIQFRELIVSLKGEHTILLSTHILSEVQATCDRIIIIDQGEIVAQESLQQLHTNVQKELRYKIKVKRKQSDLHKTLQNTDGVNLVEVKGAFLEVSFAPTKLNSEQLAKIVVNSGCGLLEFSSIKNPVESLFAELTRAKEVQV